MFYCNICRGEGTVIFAKFNNLHVSLSLGLTVVKTQSFHLNLITGMFSHVPKLFKVTE